MITHFTVVNYHVITWAVCSYSGTQVVALIDGLVPWGSKCLGCAVLDISEDKTKMTLHLYCLLCDVSISGRYIELTRIHGVYWTKFHSIQ